MKLTAADDEGPRAPTPDALTPGPPGSTPRIGPPAGSTGDGTGESRPLLLLVEDDWRTHSALRKIFMKLGWEVHSAMTVTGALAMLEFGPRGVVLDMMLPDGDGLAVLRKVRSERSDAKVVVTTGVEDPVRLDEIRRHRPEALLRKPIELADLLRALGVKRTA